MCNLKDYKLAGKVDSTVPVVRWVASLSNGETVYENNINGELSAWIRLSKYVEEKNLSITNLRLQLANTEIKLPPGQQGYIQRGVAWGFNNKVSGMAKCIGYVSNGLALIHEVDPVRGSKTTRVADPGAPQTIYRADIRTNKKLQEAG